MIFKQASGDLLLSLCDLMSVSWQIMVDDKITGQCTLHARRELSQISATLCLIVLLFLEFLELCDKWQSESKSLKDITNYRIADVQSKRMERSYMELARDFCDNEKSNNTESVIEFTDQNVRFVACFSFSFFGYFFSDL